MAAVDEGTPGRGARFAAVALDLGALLALLAIVAVAVAGWLLARTAWGRLDAGAADAWAAAALLAACVPAWGAWQLARLRRAGATFGEARAGLAVEASSARRRLLRFALHPLSVPVWGWLALTLLVSGLGGPALALAALCAIAGALAGLGGLAALALAAARPGARAPHDLPAGTRLARHR